MFWRLLSLSHLRRFYLSPMSFVSSLTCPAKRCGCFSHQHDLVMKRDLTLTIQERGSMPSTCASVDNSPPQASQAACIVHISILLSTKEPVPPA